VVLSQAEEKRRSKTNTPILTGKSNTQSRHSSVVFLVVFVRFAKESGDRNEGKEDKETCAWSLEERLRGTLFVGD
jgi:hypothetical protein